MVYGIISDIHGNLPALEVVLEALDGVDSFLCIGDVVGYGANPEECCQIVRELPCSALITGNHEAGVLGSLSPSWFNAVAWEAILWTREALSPSTLDFLRSFEVSHQGEDFILAHGALQDPYEYINSTPKARRLLEQCDPPLCIIGHTHCMEWYRRSEDGECEHFPCSEGGSLKLEKGWQYVVNCGSVGQPRDGNPQASYAIYDSEEAVITFYRREYPIEVAQERILQAGLPTVLAFRLAIGM